jgi:hypothetical protein
MGLFVFPSASVTVSTAASAWTAGTTVTCNIGWTTPPLKSSNVYRLSLAVTWTSTDITSGVSAWNARILMTNPTGLTWLGAAANANQAWATANRTRPSNMNNDEQIKTNWFFTVASDGPVTFASMTCRAMDSSTAIIATTIWGSNCYIALEDLGAIPV